MDAIYARQSVDKADSISIDSQIEFCRYETRGAPCQVFSDKGYSGKNTDRPGFLRMLQAVRRGEITRVICYKLDRCSRSILDFALLMDEFQKYHVTFVSCTEKFDTSTPMGRAMLNICIVFAQLERETIQQRVRDAYLSRSKKGFYMGGRIPFGFRLEQYVLNGKKTARYCIHEAEAELLQLMYSVYQKPSASLTDIIKALNDAGFSHPRKSNGNWIRSNIGRMLRNPIYVKADFRIYQYFKDQGVALVNDPGDFIGVNGCYLYTEKADDGSVHRTLVLAPHDGIIDADLWLRCVMKNDTVTNKNYFGKVNTSWLTGKLKCGYCGYAMIITKTAKSNGKTYRYVLCSRSRGKDCSCEDNHSIKADTLENLVEREIKECIKHIGWEKLCPVAASNRTVQDWWSNMTDDEKRIVMDALIQRIIVAKTEIRICWRI